MRVAGFVLVGGHSSRMRRDKARLPVGSRLLVENIAAKVKGVTGNVALVGESRRYIDLDLDCLDDSRASSGPLAGIEAALLSLRGELNLVVACDMPDLRVDSLLHLIKEAKARDNPCVACRDAAGRLQPLCAVWKQACLPVIQRALDNGQFKLLDLLDKIDVYSLQVAHPIPNVNTPDEWLAWQAENLERASSLT